MKTAYLDETKRKHYMICAVVVVQTDIAAVRQELMRVKGSHAAIHMTDLNDRDRMACAAALGELDVEGIVVHTKAKNDRAARDLLLAHTANYLVELGVTRLVMESCDQDREDRQVLHRTLGPEPAMSYQHLGKSELMLALPDILGWSHGRGGKYREAVKPVTTDLGQVLLR